MLNYDTIILCKDHRGNALLRGRRECGDEGLKIQKPRSYAVLRKQATGIEPAFSAWEADVLPMNYACVFYGNTVYYKLWFSKSKEIPVFFKKQESLFKMIMLPSGRSGCHSAPQIRVLLRHESQSGKCRNRFSVPYPATDIRPEVRSDFRLPSCSGFRFLQSA